MCRYELSNYPSSLGLVTCLVTCVQGLYTRCYLPSINPVVIAGIPEHKEMSYNGCRPTYLGPELVTTRTKPPALFPEAKFGIIVLQYCSISFLSRIPAIQLGKPVVLVEGIVIYVVEFSIIMIMVADRWLIVALFWYYRNKLIPTGLLSLPRMHITLLNYNCPFNGLNSY